MTGMRKSWGLTSSNSYHRAICLCFNPLTNMFACAFQGTERWTSKSSLLQVLISIQGKCSCRACGTGKGRWRMRCRLISGDAIGICHPSGLVLPFAVTLLDKAVSLSLQFFSWSRCKIFSCPDFWLHPRSLTQCFPPSHCGSEAQSCFTCYSELTKVNHCVLSQLLKALEVAEPGFSRRTAFYPR